MTTDQLPTDPAQALPASIMALLQQRIEHGRECKPHWPDLDMVRADDPEAAVHALGQLGEAEIRTLKSLLEEAIAYLPEELSSRIVELCAFAETRWSRDVERLRQAVREANEPDDGAPRRPRFRTVDDKGRIYLQDELAGDCFEMVPLPDGGALLRANPDVQMADRTMFLPKSAHEIDQQQQLMARKARAQRKMSLKA